MADEKRAKGEYGVKLVRGPFVRLPPHPDSVDTMEELPELAGRLEGPLAADLFCGAGGLSLGLEAAGYKVILGVDHDSDALETHRAYHPGLSAELDLADPGVVESIGQLLGQIGVDLIAGGPPCQPFSRAGRSGMRELVRRGVRPQHDMRRELWQSFLRIVAIARPAAALMENVPDMALDRDMLILRTMVDELEQLGYSVEERVLTTSDFGVPQFRQRLFVVALKEGTVFHWPPTADQVVSVRNAIGDLPPVEGGWRPDNGDDPIDPVASGWADYGGPTGSFQTRMREGVTPAHSDRIYDHITRPVREDDAIAFEHMDSETRYSELPEELQRYRSDIFDDKYKRLDWNGLSRTIVAHIAKDGYWYIHPDQPRTLTVREAARLQTFPDRIRFAGPPTAAFRQIGNAVPPLMGELLAKAIRASLLAGEREEVTTGQVAERLADWFHDRRQLTVPWLRAATRWQVVCAETALARLTPVEAKAGWRLLEQLPDISSTRANIDLLRMGLGTLSRGSRLESLLSLVNSASERPEAFAGDASLEVLRSVDGVMPAMADLAIRVCPGSDDDREDPVLATTGALRVASRFLGGHVEANRRQFSDGRIAIARMIGGEENSHFAHLALLELAASHCRPGTPDCGPCPLLGTCRYAAENGFQPMLPVTNRAG